MPSFVDRPAQRYVGARATIGVTEFPTIADQIPRIIGLLAQHGLAPAGAPFFRYLVIHPGMRFTAEACVPVDGDFTPEAPLITGVVPAGKYVFSNYIGHPDGLFGATKAVLDWGAAEGVRWDSTETEDGEQWGGRLEVLNTNPLEQPDPTQWSTDLLFRVAG
ncbi:GyrI-like domain-containing protein [Amycolatopsis sp. NPDC059021]|uniref:GyrI-like domain-containing protein n=1 Tax=Amycolatopsis sp. NPDC059021 TaxID=3346704 RepID=UPI00366B15A2